MPLAPLVTVEEFLNMRIEEPVELVRGRVVVMPRPQLPHSRAQARLTYRLSQWAERTGRGEVFGEFGSILERGPDTVRAPDVAFVSSERPVASDAEGFFDGAPDLAIEIRSPGNTLRALVAKGGEYLAHGARLVWIVDPKRQRVTVLTHDARVELSRGDVLTGGELLPGFELPLDALFRA